MLAKIGLSLLFATLAICDPKGHRWQHPLSTDRKAEGSHTLFNDGQLTISLGRSPCPGINAIANHGYLPRNGLNISLEQFITGFREGLNFDAEFVRDAVKVYQPFTTTGYNNTLNLNDLDHHSIPGEHDGSLSRNNLFFGDNYSFNKTIWNTVAAHFHNDTISIPVAARARQDRFDAARAINKEFTPSSVSSFGESALYLKAMRGQDKETKTKYVQILFREERIPFKEGYKRSNVSISNKDVGVIAFELARASGCQTLEC
ncbi:MAG: hypothetical protein L6R42_004647 [Xanthoria sp. 1 TBL-2021]|nr:MAG: hypothetical protein L6R42_004647 [Xanthoria sp. 1 TBL-2021]